MNAKDLAALVVIARDAAVAAGEVARRGFRRAVAVEHKGTVDLVTSYDRDSEALLRERLAATSFPVFGEEGGGSIDPRAPDATGFFVDPIDGTTNFVHGHPFWNVSVGLVIEGTPVLGAVVAPMLGLAWWGFVADDGTRMARRRAVLRRDDAAEEEDCRVTATRAFEDCLFATGFPYDRSANTNFDAFIAVKKRCQAVRRCGAAALDLCLVADGTYDGYWERRLSPWDLAAGVALVRAAGGRVTDLSGKDGVFALGDVIATNGVVHASLQAELARVEAAKPTVR